MLKRNDLSMDASSRSGPPSSGHLSVSDALSDSERRLVLAFLEAMIPGSRNIPAGDERTLEMSLELLEHLSPTILRAFVESQRVLDLSAVPIAGARFTKLSFSAQQEVLRSWEKNPALRGIVSAISFAYKFAHFDRQHIYEKMGGRLNVVQEVERHRWESQVFRADDWDDPDPIECEVVVVGTGAGGAVVGRELAAKGLAVVFVEEGKMRSRKEFTGSSLQAHKDLYRGAVSFGNSVIPVFMGRLVGGSTAINTGSSYRTPPWILDEWCERIGTDELSAERMEPYFDLVEQRLGVEPADERFIGPIGDIMRRGSEALGWSSFVMRRNAPGCQGEGFCDFGCRTDARRSTNLSYLPPALESGSLLLTELEADRVLIEGGRAVGISGRSPEGKRVEVRARAVIWAGGAVPTPHFLLKNKLCNSSGQVGKNLTLHPSAGFTALFDEEIDGHRYIPQGYGIDEFLPEGILIAAAQPDRNFAPLVFPYTGQRLMDALEQSTRMASFGILVKDHAQSGRVHLGPTGGAVVSYSLAPEDVAKLHRGMVATARMCLAAGAKRIFPVVMSEDPFDDHEGLERFAKKKLTASQMMLTSYHPIGSCRIGKDPRSCVVDLSHEAFDLPGFFIVDGSTVPGPPSVNPQVTIMAMATRAADRIAERLAG